jgi:hypothetical protein
MEPSHHNTHHKQPKQSAESQNVTSPILEQLLHGTSCRIIFVDEKPWSISRHQCPLLEAIHASESRNHRLQALQCALQLFTSQQQHQPHNGPSSRLSENRSWDVQVVSHVLRWRLERIALDITVFPIVVPAENDDHNMTADNHGTSQLIWMELSLICANLDAAWSLEDKSLRETMFLRLPDNTNTLHLLLRILSATLQHNEQATTTTATSNQVYILEAMWRILQLIRLWAKLKEGTLLLLSYRESDVPVTQQHTLNECWIMSSVVDLLWSLLESDDDNCTILSQLETEAVGLIKDLSFRATPVEKTIIYHVDGFLSFLIHWCEHHHYHQQRPEEPIRNTQHQLQESIAAIVWNLALHPELSQDMNQHAAIPRALCCILTTSTNSKARRNATSALGNMIVTSMGQELRADQNSATTVSDGFSREEWLIQSLMTCVQHDGDPDTRRRAMRTLRCLVGHCPMLRHDRADLLPFLLHTAVTQPAASTHSKHEEDPSEHHHHGAVAVRHLDTQLQACEALAHLARDQPWLQQQGPQLEAGLIAIIQNSGTESFEQLPPMPGEVLPPPSINPKVVISIARALSHCIERSPWTRSLSCYSTSFFSNLYKAIRSLNAGDDSPSAHFCVSRLLQQLVNVAVIIPTISPTASQSTTVMAMDTGPMARVTTPQFSASSASSKLWFVAHSSFLDMLTFFLSEMGKSQQADYELSIHTAIEIVVTLLSVSNDEDAVVRAMAEHEGLLTALVNVCLVTQDLDLKSKVKHSIMALVPKL